MNKEDLRKIVENNYEVPDGLSEYEAVQQVVGVLSSPDGELRDELGCTVLSKWLLKKKLLNNLQLTELLEQATSRDMFFYKIGESDTDSVFLRTFSSLLIALILIRDNEEHFLSSVTFHLNMKRLINYCELEKDYRSYVEGKGWAHGPAHVADALDECVRSRYTAYNECEQLWIGLLTLLKNAPNVFDAEEDERIATAVIAMIELEKVSISTLCDWLSTVEAPIEYDLQEEVKRKNYKMFIRCLYMRLREKNLLGAEENRLFEIQHQFNRF
jgi:hypothetical protein